MIRGAPEEVTEENAQGLPTPLGGSQVEPPLCALGCYLTLVSTFSGFLIGSTLIELHKSVQQLL